MLILGVYVVETWNVDPRNTGQSLQQVFTTKFQAMPQRVGHSGGNNLAFADHERVEHRSQRLGVGSDAGTAGNKQRVGFVSVFSPQGNAGLLQHGNDVEVVQLEGEGESQYRKVGQRALRFQRNRHTVLFMEDPFTDYVRLLVEEAVDDMHSQVGHADAVGVGIGNGDR